MSRFTKEQMLDELRTIFLFEADHILMGAGSEMAERFIGFPTGEQHEYCHMPPSMVDLSRFEIASVFEQGYDYAFRPSVLNSLEEHRVQDLNTFMLGAPRAGGISSGGETHAYMTPDGFCQTTVDTVFARWKLEWEAHGGHTFTTRELALLANMTEGAVRNALADKSENGLRAIPGSKPVSVEHDEALRWLHQRRGFVPSPTRARDDRFLIEHLKEVATPEALGQIVWKRILPVVDRSVFAEPGKIQWTKEEIDAWCRGTFEFDADRARELAEALDIDPPLFVGKALEVSMRRNALASEGGAS